MSCCTESLLIDSYPKPENYSAHLLLLSWLADKFKASWKAIRDLEKWEQYQRSWQTFAFLAGSCTGSLPSSRLPSSHSQREQDRVARGSNASSGYPIYCLSRCSFSNSFHSPSEITPTLPSTT